MLLNLILLDDVGGGGDIAMGGGVEDVILGVFPGCLQVLIKEEDVAAMVTIACNVLSSGLLF